MNLTCKINNVEFEIENDFRINQILSYKSKSKIKVLVTDSEPKEKDRVELFLGTKRLYYGRIEKSTSPIINTGLEPLSYSLDCSSIESVLNDRPLIKAYENTTLDVVLLDIYTTIINPEEIADSYDFAGTENIPVGSIVFNGNPTEDALNKLADLGDCIWYIRHSDKKFIFKPVADYEVLPTIYAELKDLDHFTKVKRTVNGVQVRNLQGLTGATDKTSVQTQIFTGDGETQTFPVGYPIIQEPIIETSTDQITWTPKNVGVRGLNDGDPTVEWFWSFNSIEVSQNFLDTPLTSSEFIRIQYVGAFPIGIEIKDQVRVDKLKARVGGTGIVGVYTQDRSYKDSITAIQGAETALNKFKDPKEEFTAEVGADNLTFDDFEVGKYLQFNMPDRFMIGNFLITEIIISFFRFDGDSIKFNKTIKAIKGDVTQGYGQIFQMLTSGLRAINIREDETILQTEFAEETLTLKEEIEIYTSYPKTPSRADAPIMLGFYGTTDNFCTAP